jgi:RNA polymerase-binding transcription factor DksA
VEPAAARRRIAAEQERLTGIAESLRRQLVDQSANGEELAQYDQHPADVGTDVFEREKDQAILEQVEADLAELEAALARVEDGTYGVDEETGEPIDDERLDALPAARTNARSARRP